MPKPSLDDEKKKGSSVYVYMQPALDTFYWRFGLSTSGDDSSLAWHSIDPYTTRHTR